MDAFWNEPKYRKLEQRSYGELIERVRDQQASLTQVASTSKDADQTLSAEAALVQWRTTLDNLMSSPPNGRVTIEVSSNIHAWANTMRDISVRGRRYPDLPQAAKLRTGAKGKSTDQLQSPIALGRARAGTLCKLAAPPIWPTAKPSSLSTRMEP